MGSGNSTDVALVVVTILLGLREGVARILFRGRWGGGESGAPPSPFSSYWVGPLVLVFLLRFVKDGSRESGFPTSNDMLYKLIPLSRGRINVIFSRRISVHLMSCSLRDATRLNMSLQNDDNDGG